MHALRERSAHPRVEARHGGGQSRELLLQRVQILARAVLQAVERRRVHLVREAQRLLFHGRLEVGFHVLHEAAARLRRQLRRHRCTIRLHAAPPLRHRAGRYVPSELTAEHLAP